VELGERLVKSAAALANNRVTATVLTSLNDVEREIAILTARLEAAAPEVAIELGAAGAGKISIGDVLLAGNAVHAAIDPLTIRVADVATITVTPPKAASAVDQKKRQDAQRRLSKLIEDAGVASASDLRAARARREALEAEAMALRAELKMLGISEASPALEIEGLKTEIQAIDAMVAEALAQMKVDSLPSAEDIAGRQDGLRLNREEARRQRQVLDGAIDAQNTILSNVADARGRLGGTLTEIQNRLEADLAILPDSDRLSLVAAADKAVKDAQGDYRIKAAALEEQRQKAPSVEELERRQNRVTRLLNALDNQKTRLGTLDREIANLEGQIQNAGGDGLGEKVEELRQARDLTEREVEKYKGRVETLLLLKSTIEACYTEQRDRLHAPLRRHLKPFLNDVFPAAEIELGDGFSIAGIRRNGPNAENFERLSAGTQEQIAVLVRLAMGAMIYDRAQPVPIILDDALVFSDDDRIEQMFDALNRAGLKQQVIVLTCRTLAFALLGGRQLSIATSPG
jgi:DNA repair exonuclease SbcCD ATPase subunit